MSANATVLSTDVLIIGGGSAGMWTAKTARQHVKDVLIVDKGPLDWGGLCSMSDGNFIVPHEGENLMDWLDDIVYYYDGLCDQKETLDTLAKSRERFRDYEAMGHTFARNPDGSYHTAPQRGLPHIKATTSAPLGKGGQNMRRELLTALKELNVRRMGNVMITKIIKDGDTVSGAAGFFTRSGLPLIIRARTVVLATGIGGWKTSYHQNSISSGCVEHALSAGAKLRSMEFAGIWNTPERFAWTGQSVLLPLGARFLNANGEDFMLNHYSPIIGSKTDTLYNVRAMVLETRAGRGPITFDVSRIPPEGIASRRPEAGWMKLNDAKLKAKGVDFFTDTQVWIPQLQTSQGGVQTDSKGATCVPGLYAVGTAQSHLVGVYFGGFSLCQAATSGYDTGLAAGEYAASRDMPAFDFAFAEDCLARELDHLGRPGIMPKDMDVTVLEVVTASDVSILKSAGALNRALDAIMHIRSELVPSMAAPDPHYLGKLIEARGMATLTEAFIRSSLTRTESRAGHFREDFPNRDESTPPYWVVLSMENGKMKTHREYLPMEEYPIKPNRFYMDQFNWS